jgi:N-acetylglucosamine transport system substrate-binding protein
MTDSRAPLSRRSILRGALWTAAAVPFGVTLASCATGGGGGGGGGETSDAPTATGDADNPFGVEEGSSVDAVIFDGGYGVDYVEFAADAFDDVFGGEATVSPSTQIASEMQPRFVGGNPPDLLDNSGAQAIGFGTILDQLERLEDVLDAPNLEGTTIRDTLISTNVLDSGVYDGQLKAINYVLTVYGVWYSASLFADNGWTVPTTWE